MVQACLVLAGLEALLHAPAGFRWPPGMRPLTEADLARQDPGALRSCAHEVLHWTARVAPAMSLPFPPLCLRRALLRLAGWIVEPTGCAVIIELSEVSPVTGPRSPVYHRKNLEHNRTIFNVIVTCPKKDTIMVTCPKRETKPPSEA